MYMLSIDQVIRLAGGVGRIASHSSATDPKNGISRDAVYKWKSIGIPDRHWPLLISLARSESDFQLTPQQLLDANLVARTAA